MSFELAQGSKASLGTTTANFKVEALGMFPKVILGFSETRPSKLGPLRVVSAEDLDEDGKFEVLHLDPQGMDPSTIEGVVLAHVENPLRVVLGDVSSVTAHTLVLAEGLGTDPSGIDVWIAVLNAVRMIPQEEMDGAAWEVELSTADAAQAAAVATLMAAAYIDAVMQVLALLADAEVPVPTLEQVQGAVVTLGGEGINLWHFLSSQAEEVERGRRMGTLHPTVRWGNAP